MLRFAAITLVAALGFSAQLSARAADAPQDGPKPRHRDGEQGGGRPGEKFREQIMHVLFDGITLDDAQKDALKKIHKENHAKHKAFAKEHKDELKAFGETMKQWHEDHKAEFEAARKEMRDAREAKDREAGKKVREKMKALLESRPKMPEALKAGLFDPEKAEAQIRGILHPDQVAKFDENVKELKEKRTKFEEGGFVGGPRGHEGKDRKDGEGRPHRRGKAGGGADGKAEADGK